MWNYRAMIGYKEVSKDPVRCIYLHWDGSFEYTGRILLDHYNTDERVHALIHLGNLSELHMEVGKRQDIYNPEDDTCLSYYRDWDDKQQVGYLYPNIESFWFNAAENHNVQYLYLWNGYLWLARGTSPENSSIRYLYDYLKGI